MRQRPEPPRWAESLLAAVLPDGPKTEALLGDLEEEFQELCVRRRLDGDGPNPTWWYLREAAGVAGRSLVIRREEANRMNTHGQRNRTMGTSIGMMMGKFSANMRFAMRRLFKRPLFTMVALVSLALGIGANTAIFSLVNATILNDPPYAEADRLVDIYIKQPGFTHSPLSYPDLDDLTRMTSDAFSVVGGAQLALVQMDREDDGVEMVLGEAVTGEYFSLLGINPVVGRVFTADDNVSPGAHPVAVLSHGLWQRRFNGDPGAVGAELRLAGRSYTVIGVAPEAFEGSLRGIVPEIFVPAAMSGALYGLEESSFTQRGNHSYFVKGRLLPGATLAQAQTVMDRIQNDFREDHPEIWTVDRSFNLTPTADVIMNPMVDRVLAPAAMMLMVVVGLVLLVACANLASFLLAQAADRRKEIAIRLAMGATRRELVGQLLTESLLLATVGGVAGVALSTWALRGLLAADLPLPLPIALDLSPDSTVLGFSILVSVAAGMFFGLAPALQSTNPDLAPTLRDETAGGGRARGAALRNMLVVSQVAVSLVLLVGAGLFLRSLDASRKVTPGFGDQPAGLVDVIVPASNYDDAEAAVFVHELVDEIAGLPGVQASGITDNLQLDPLNNQGTRVNVDGIDPPPGRDDHRVDYATVDGGFFRAVGIEAVQGRLIDDTDTEDSAPVLVISETFARQFFPNGDPVGRTVRIRGEETTVVGVARDTKVGQIGEDPTPFLYVPFAQNFRRNVTFVANTTGDAHRLATQMFGAIRGKDDATIVMETKTMERHLAVQRLPRQLGALVVGAMASLAMLLACIGLYGVVSYAVARRSREVGIRMSLGAEPRSVVWMMTSGGMRLVAIGGVVGLALSAALAQLLSRLLYGVPALDPVTFVGVPAVLGTVALVASWIPARRASRVNPVRMLRSD